MPILVPLTPLDSKIGRLHQARPNDKPEVTLLSKNDEGVSAACCGFAHGAFDSLFVIVYYACIQMYTVLALAI